MSADAIPPAGSVSASGQGCTGGSAVELTVDTVSVGATKADASGAFSTPLHVGSLPVGQYRVVAHCGVELTSDLDVVLGTQADPDTSTLLIIVFFLLVGLAVFRRRIRLDAPASVPPDTEDDEGVTGV